MADNTVGFIDLSIELCVCLAFILCLYLSYYRVKMNPNTDDQTTERRQIMRLFAIGFIGFRGLQFVFYMAMFSSPTKALEGCSAMTLVGMVVCFTAIMYNLLVNYFTRMNTLVHFAQSQVMTMWVRRIGLVGSVAFSMSLIIGILAALAADEPVIFVYTVGFVGVSSVLITFGALAFITFEIRELIRKATVASDTESDVQVQVYHNRYRRRLLILGVSFTLGSLMALVFLLLSYVIPVTQGKDLSSDSEWQYEKGEWVSRGFNLLVCGTIAYAFWVPRGIANLQKLQSTVETVPQDEPQSA